MYNNFITLAELNELLGTCSVNSAQLEELGFFPFDKSVLKADMFSENAWRKYRNAKLYQTSQLADIRATIGASMRDACCELRLLGRELVNAETELPATHSIIVTVDSGKTTIALGNGVVSTPMSSQQRPLHAAVRQAIQCALAEVAVAQRHAGHFHQKQ